LAKKLVAESGYKGEKITFTYTISQIAYADQVTQAIANYFQAVGINVELQPLDGAATTQLAIGRKFPGIFISIFAPSIMDADLGILIFYEKGFRGFWIDDAVQTLAAQQRAEGDPVKRRALISQIWQRSREDTGMIYLYNEIWAFGMTKNLVWTPPPDGGLVFQKAFFADVK
jgi:peptide/nickel transport system substrate-binding protein